MTAQTLLLNASYEPLGIISWQRAIELFFGDKVFVLETYEADVRSTSICIKMPAVVVLKRFVNIRPKIKFSRKNIYIRDEFNCQYCGKNANKLPNKVKDLTFDHVLPRCQGGKTTWLNIATACFDCNHRKAGRTPKQAKMHLRRKPFEPKSLNMVTFSLVGRPTTPEQWRTYLYWETDLEP